ncbi:DUF2235 domain-containing protein [Methylocystis sp. B8]|nr:DUF2235 domain-containing protein [Methylocystis sp. B8]
MACSELPRGRPYIFFGFSRGAYTARYVAGIICSYGLTDFSTKTPSDEVMWQQVDRVFEACRNRPSR